MNKYLRQNWKIWNHIQFHPLAMEVPEDETERMKWAESTWTHLCEDDIELIRKSSHTVKGTDKWVICVVADDEYCYLIQCLRTEYNTDDTTVYMKPKSKDNVNDFIAISKFIHRDITKILNQSRKDVKQFNELINEPRTQHTKPN